MHDAEWIASLAKAALRYDTAMSRAMLRALGIAIPDRNRGRARPAKIQRVDVYEGIRECFQNKTPRKL